MFTQTFIIQTFAFVLLFTVLAVSLASLFIRPARRTVRASLRDNFNGKIIDISHAETSFGKAKSCDVVLTYMSVSRFHCVLSNSQNGWMIFDTHSSVGTFVNGSKIEKKCELKDGDIIQIGAGEFTFYSRGINVNREKAKRKKTDRPISERRNTTGDKKSVGR